MGCAIVAAIIAGSIAPNCSCRKTNINMPERIVRVRRRRRRYSLSALESLDILRRDLSPKRAAILIVAIVIIFAVGTISYHYGSSFYRGWRERNLLRQASSLLAREQLSEAAQRARDVLQQHPDSLAAFHILAETAEKRNLEEAVAWRAQIARLLPHDLDSELNLASAALRFGQLDTARKALDAVASNDRSRARFHVVAGWLAQAEGNIAEQERQFAAAVQKEPGNDVYQFNLAVLQIRSPDSERRGKAKATLERLSQIQSFRTGALRALLSDAIERGDLTSADDLAGQLQLSQQVTFTDYLLCLNLYRKLDQKKFDALLEKLKPVAGRNAVDLALLMDWMNNNGLAAEVIKWIDKLPPGLTSSGAVATAVAEAFSQLRNWSRLRRWTRNENWGSEDYVRLAYQSHATRQLRQAVADAEADRLWHSAEQAASAKPDAELKLAKLATEWNLKIEADQLWSKLSNNPPTRREALDALYRLYRTSNQLRKLYDVLQRLHEASPNEIAITADLARLGLNIDQNTSQAQALAKEAYERAPDDLNCAVTYAFSLYGMGRAREGLAAIQQLPPEKLHDPHAAVYIATLLLDENQADAAREYIEAAQRGPLFSEEKKLLEEAKAKLASAMATPTPTPPS
jgi:Tfp pilus assembly protein PilF